MSLPEDDPALIARLLAYVYTGDFLRVKDDIPSFANIKDGYTDTEEAWSSNIDLITAMYNLGEKYLMPELKFRAGRYLMTCLRDADDYFEEFGGGGLNSVNEMILDAVQRVYTSTSRDAWQLRSPILHHIFLETRYSTERPKWELYEKVIREIPDLAFDLAKGGLMEDAYICPKCKQFIRQLWWICFCGKTTSCGKIECYRQRCQRRMCMHCCQFGDRT